MREARRSHRTTGLPVGIYMLSQVMSTEAPGYAVPDHINPEDYLDKLQSDDYQ